MWDSRIFTTPNHVQMVTLGVNFLFTPYYFSNKPPHKWKLIKHNTNANADTEKVEEKLLYREMWLLVRGVHESVWIEFVPNLQLTQWHRVSSEKTRRQQQKPTGQVGLDLFDRQSDRLKLTKMLPKVPFGGGLYFSQDLCWIYAKLTRFEEKNIKSLPNLCKTHKIWAKKNQIVAGFEQKPSKFHRI